MSKGTMKGKKEREDAETKTAQIRRGYGLVHPSNKKNSRTDQEKRSNSTLQYHIELNRESRKRKGVGTHSNARMTSRSKPTERE